MAKTHQTMIDELGRYLDELAGERARKKVLEESAQLTSDSDPRQVALWLKEAMERLDAAVDKKTGARVMERCGRTCAEAGGTLRRVVAKRTKYKTLDKFLEAEKTKLLPGMRLERGGLVHEKKRNNHLGFWI